MGLILQYLSLEDILTFGAACDQTLNAIKLGNLWECIDMADFGVVSSYHRYNILSSVSWYVKDFTMKHQSFVYLHASIVPGLIASFANIQKLDLTGAFNVHTLKFLQHTSKLVTLNIDGCTRICRNSTKEDINKCPSISHLSMANLSQLTHHDLREGLKNLHFLDVMGTNNCPPAFVVALLNSNQRMQTFLFSSYFFMRDMELWVNLVFEEHRHKRFHWSTYEALIDYKHLFDMILYGGLPPISLMRDND